MTVSVSLYAFFFFHTENFVCISAIATLGVDDVRPVLQYYHQFDDPLKQFRENQRKLKEEQDRQAQLQKDAQQSRIGFSMGGLWRR